MSNQTQKPALLESEEDFGQRLSMVLSPSQPLQSQEFLRGREKQLAEIRKALYAPGRHVLIHGFRGVGKSSLAQTAAFSISKSGNNPIILSCDSSSSFNDVIRDMFEEAANPNPLVKTTSKQKDEGFDFKLFAAKRKHTIEEGRIEQIQSINEAVRLTGHLCEKYSEKPVIIIDEFDQIQSKYEQENFANFIKQISDKRIPARFIFCGIGESVDALMSAHGSADRYFHTVSLGRLPYEAREEIVTYAADNLGISVDSSTMYRIAKISDGFPHYVHLISEKLFWRVFEARNDGMVTGALFENAMADASDAMEMKLKHPYETATRKYTNDYENVLFAVADGHELQRRSSVIYLSYVRIMESQGLSPLSREKFNGRMNSLKKENYASILTASRTGWYEFSEKVIRGYCRLRAEQVGVELEVDHPRSKKRFGTSYMHSRYA